MNLTRFGTVRPMLQGIATVLFGGLSYMSAAEPEQPVRLGPHGPSLTRVVIDSDFPGAYQVEIADVNGDGKHDIVALGGGTVAWYENPSWTKRIVSDPKTTPGVISTATRDIDGDGKAEIAIAYEFEMNQPKRGKLLIARQAENGWNYEKIGDFPSIHRLRWGDFDGDGKADLAIAPIFGATTVPPTFQGQGANLVVLFGDGDQKPGAFKTLQPRNSVISNLPVMHAIGVVRWTDPDRKDPLIDSILSASNGGIWLHRFRLQIDPPSWSGRVLSPGGQGTAPKIGASEIHLGRFNDGRKFLAAIEPWHGTDVTVVVQQPGNGLDPVTFGDKKVLDNKLVDGHALCVADIDGDGTDEVFAGYRGKGTSVVGYRFEAGEWNRTVIDDKIAAQDLRSADMDGDGHHDIVAVGGSTKNVVLYLSVSP
jgi:hypothetical protein